MENFIEIFPGTLKERISIPASKSFANRALIMAAMAKHPVSIKNLPLSSDFENLLSSLKKIGIKVFEKENEVIIEDSFPECEQEVSGPISLYTGDGGTTNRFLIPFLARGKNEYWIYPDKHFMSRPIQDLISPLVSLGIKIEGPSYHGPWLKVQGPYNFRRDISIDCARSTQFASGIMMATSDLSEISLNFENLSSSKTYFEMTQWIVKSIRKDVIEVPIDFSSLSYPLAFSILHDRLVVPNQLKEDPFQADSIFIKILEECGADISWTNEGLKSSSSNLLTPVNWDCLLCPDLVPALCFLFSYVDGKSSFKNIKNLKYKECDRLTEICHILSLFEIEHDYLENEDCLVIEGNSEKISPFVSYDAPPDHRMIMMAALFMFHGKGGRIRGASHVQKSFSNFFEIFDKRDS